VHVVPDPADERIVAAYAFQATVIEVSDDVDPPWTENSPFDWHVELDVTRTYRGDIPARLIFNGWDGAACHRLLGPVLRVGERLFIVSDEFQVRDARVDPFWTGDADVIAWRRVGDGWAFYAEALYDSGDPEFYPATARNATTTAEILRLIALGLPNTATSSDPSRQSPPFVTIGVQVLSALAGTALFLRRMARRQPSADW
jgi:hypothetical protein